MINWTKKDPELCPILGESSTGATFHRSVNTMDPHRGPLSRRTRFLLVVCILFTELCERLTFYGIVANLVLYCRDFLKLEAPLPSSISLGFQGRFLNFLVDIYLRNRKHVYTVFLSNYRNTSGSLGEREMLWEHELQASISTPFSSFSQTFMSVSIT